MNESFKALETLYYLETKYPESNEIISLMREALSGNKISDEDMAAIRTFIENDTKAFRTNNPDNIQEIKLVAIRNGKLLHDITTAQQQIIRREEIFDICAKTRSNILKTADQEHNG